MDTLIRDLDMLEKLVQEEKTKQIEAAKLFKKDQIIDPVHPDIKEACLTRLTDSTDIQMIYNLAKIARLSKDEVREHVCRWIREETNYNFTKLSEERLKMILELV